MSKNIFYDCHMLNRNIGHIYSTSLNLEHSATSDSHMPVDLVTFWPQNKESPKVYLFSFSSLFLQRHCCSVPVSLQKLDT